MKAAGMNLAMALISWTDSVSALLYDTKVYKDAICISRPFFLVVKEL
jgi:hypothetical protein